MRPPHLRPNARSQPPTSNDTQAARARLLDHSSQVRIQAKPAANPPQPTITTETACKRPATATTPARASNSTTCPSSARTSATPTQGATKATDHYHERENTRGRDDHGEESEANGKGREKSGEEGNDRGQMTADAASQGEGEGGQRQYFDREMPTDRASSNIQTNVRMTTASSHGRRPRRRRSPRPRPSSQQSCPRPQVNPRGHRPRLAIWARPMRRGSRWSTRAGRQTRGSEGSTREEGQPARIEPRPAARRRLPLLTIASRATFASASSLVFPLPFINFPDEIAPVTAELKCEDEEGNARAGREEDGPFFVLRSKGVGSLQCGAER